MASDDVAGRARSGRPWRRFAVVGVLVALDLWTKALVFGWLDPSTPGARYDLHGHLRYPLVEPWLGWMLSCNPGAAFGQFGDWPYLLVFGRALAICVLFVLVWRADARHRVATAAMVLVLAGAAGNLADNLGLGCEEPGHPFRLVRDFIDVWFRSDALGWDWHFPTFNVADSCITVGAVAWILAGLLGGEHAGSGEARDGDAGEPGPGA